MSTNAELVNKIETFMSTMINKDSEIQALKNQLAEALQKIEELKAKKVRDRGPKSTRKMSAEDAMRILPGGDMEHVPHREAAEELGLSYGQIYSARHNHTFRKLQ